MATFLRLIVSLISGIVFYAALVFTVFRFAMPLVIKRILLWNVVVFSSLGRGDPVGYMPNGQPIYDGAVGYGGFTTASILTGFVIYPILIFIVLTTWNKFKTSN